MHIEDYVHPDDQYTPDPRASQRVAAQKRAQRSTDDPESLTPPLAIPARRYVPFGVGALVLIIAILATQRQLDHAPLQITPAAAEVAQAFGADPKISPVASQEARTAPTAPPRTINAYAAPDGVLLGPIEETRRIVPVAHYGADWLAYQDGSGLVWVRTSDRPDLALTGPDLAPAPQGRGLTASNNEWTPPEAPQVLEAEPTPVPWPVSAPIAPDSEAPNIKQHFNAPHAPGQDG